MITVKTHPAFDTWIEGLKDKATVIRLRARLKKATLCNLGDVAPVGSGVS
jgi:putative addiction module killer protein